MNPAKHMARVWAPAKDSLELHLESGTHRMERSPGQPGWWCSNVMLNPGDMYGFVVDGRGPFPDPRSLSQPQGVHGLSEVVDHQAHGWTDADYQPVDWEDAVLYEVHVGTFSPSGTFEGMIPYLSHLTDLGITHIELMPICEFPGARGWGYDGVSLYAPHHAYGGVSGLKNLIDACHRHGLAVIIDVVYNHLGPDGNYLPTYGPYFTDRYQTPWGDAPNLDGSHSGPEVRAFFLDNALMWLDEYHADGLRLDAIDKVVDHSEKHFLRELGERVRQLEMTSGKRKVLIAESAQNDPLFVMPTSQGGHGLDAQWNDDLHHSMRTIFTGEREGYFVDYGSALDTAKALRNGFVYDGRYSAYRKNHHGKPSTGLPGHSYIGYIQNHDQIGNRASGDRFHHHPSVDELHHRIASTFVLLAPFIPMIFMGEEWAASTPFQYFTDHQNPDLARAVSEGRKKEFGVIGWLPEDIPDPQHPHAFEASKLLWDECEKSRHQEMLQWYKQLLTIRKSHAEFGSRQIGNVSADGDTEGRWLWMRRGESIIAACLHGNDVEVPVPISSMAKTLISAGSPAVLSPQRSLIFDSPGVLVFKTEP